MEIKDLFSGIAVIIDDEVDNPVANINDLLDQLKALNIPYIKFKKLPDEGILDHFEGISFILLDWKLKDTELSEYALEGVTSSEVLREFGEQENVKFLGRIRSDYFVPVFIFTNDDNTHIESILKDNELLQEEKPNFIFVRSKSELSDGRLFKEIESWLKTTPPVYVLKVWEYIYKKAKNSLFNEFYNLSPSWPIILWKNFKADLIGNQGQDVAPSDNTNIQSSISKELCELITRNLYTRLQSFSFEGIDVNDDEGGSATPETKKAFKEEVRKVLEGERFIKNSQLIETDIGTGDIFMEQYEENNQIRFRYYLNIRPQCDLLRQSNPELYCLKGWVLDETSTGRRDNISSHEGQIKERTDHSIIPFIAGGKIMEFRFKDLKIKKWNILKEKRIGRLLPPYITYVQQKYSLYLHRQALPRIPEDLLGGHENGDEQVGEKDYRIWP